MLIYPTGSYFICNPPVQNTDIDFLIYMENIEDFCKDLEKIGFVKGGGDYVGDKFSSYKQTTISGTILNYLVTDNFIWYCQMTDATDIAKEHNLVDKKERVALFREIVGD